MILFASDLDNTLIYSYKREIGKKVLVETMGEKELSFMTENTWRLLKELPPHMMFVPVSTRSEEQYKRICFPGGQPEYALVCNGGILLHKGERDRAWYESSLNIKKQGILELEQGKRIMEGHIHRKLDVREVGGLFLFTKSSEPEQLAGELSERLDGKKVKAFTNGEKVYLLPAGLDKGTGLKRLKEKLKPELTVCAGDSEFDLPMLREGDKGIMPSCLSSFIFQKGTEEEKTDMALGENGKYLIVRDSIFSDKVIEYLLYVKNSQGKK